MARIEFKRVSKKSKVVEPSGEGAARDASLPKVGLASREEVQERLFYFLRGLSEGRLLAPRPLLVDQEGLQALYEAPHPDLVAALGHCLDAFLLTVSPDAACWGALVGGSAIWGVVLATYNCLGSPFAVGQAHEGALIDFMEALLKLLPPARTLPDLLLYHAILHHPAAAWSNLPQSRQPFLQALLIRSPLTALYHLHHAILPPLSPLGAELLPAGARYAQSIAPWTSLEAWLEPVLLLLSEPQLAKSLRRRWLTLPESRAASLNVGLLLEALRRQGGQEDFILQFYEAYDHHYGQEIKDLWQRTTYRTGWPLLDEIEDLLRFDYHEQDAAIRLNRYGNERFLKFWSLLQIVKSQGGIIPPDYKHLSLHFVKRVDDLMPLTTIDGQMDVVFGEVAYESGGL